MSVITRMELLSFPSLEPESEREIRCFLSTMRVVPLNGDIEDQAVGIRRKTKLRLPDAIVLATASSLKCPLVTSDADLLRLRNDYHVIEPAE